MRTLEQILRWTVIAGAFLLPFVVFYVAKSLFFPFITGKNFYFRIVVEFMATAWLALALVLPQYRPKRNWILGTFAIFVLIMAVADAQGVNPFKSFWSNFERMDGWVTIAHTLVYLVVVSAVINTERLWRTLFQVSLAVSVGVGLYGMTQLFGWSAVGQGGATGLSARLDATFGNAIYLAVYDLFHIFIAALLWVQAWHERKPGNRTWISLMYAFIIFFDTFILLFTGTRGTTLGLIGGALLAGIIYVMREPSAIRARNYVLGALAGLVILSGVLWSVRSTPEIARIGFLVRLANISVSDPTVQSRFMNIGMAWQGVKERPILGWGQENYAIVFDKYYDPRMYNAEQWFDRVHDSIFDWFVAGGILGLAAYLSIFGAILYYLWTSKAFRLDESAILIGLIAGYFFHNLFVFDNVTSYILFGTVLGYIVWRESEARKTRTITDKQFMPNQALAFSAFGACLAMGGLGWYVNGPAMQQNRMLIQALMDGSQGKYDVALSDFQKAADMGALGTQEVREQLAQAAAQVGTSGLPTDLKQKYVEAAIEEMKKQQIVSPLDARFPLFLGMVYQSAGDLVNAQTAFDRARELSPTKQTILYQVAQNALSRNDPQGAVEALKHAYEIEPKNIEALIYYASILIRAGNDTVADEVLAPEIATGRAADQRISSAYASRNMYGKIIEIWKARIVAMPDDTQSYFTLAAAYYAVNDKTSAINTLQAIAQKDPAAQAQASTYIEQIKNGTVPKVQ